MQESGVKRDNYLIYKKLDQALGQWAKEMKKTNVPITANMTKEKAKELSTAMGHGLKPSTAWLYKWKDRENIKFAKQTKDPEKVLKEFLYKKRGEQIALDEKLIFKSIDDRQAIRNLQFKHLSSKPRGTENKTRTKRLSIIDASGLIFRRRKEKTFLTLLQKIEILKRLKNGERRLDLIMEYNLSHSAMSQIVTDEKRILKLAAGGQNLQMKRIRGGIFKNGEAELNAWVQAKMENGESLTRTEIKNRAKEIAVRLNIDFKASTGWLEKWKARMNLDFNENQKLQRKFPIYMPTDEIFENSQLQFEQSNSFCDQRDREILENQIKEEQIDIDCDFSVTNDKFMCSIDVEDIKPKSLTPYQFYLQTIQCGNEKLQKEEQVKQEQLDNLPSTESSQHIFETDEIDIPSQTVHEQILLWLSRYNIDPVAASELLNILQRHLTSVGKHFSNVVQQKRNIF